MVLEEFRGGHREKFEETHGPFERDSAGNLIMFCSSDTYRFPYDKKRQKELYGRTFTKKEAKEYEELFVIANLCQCGEPMEGPKNHR